jgi:hypothetical protein
VTLFGFRKNSDAGQLERDVVNDSEAFLLGHLAERFMQQGSDIPAWAWLNLLAHATYDELRSEVTAEPMEHLGVRNWQRLRAYLATEVLAIADGPGTLLALQESVLRSLELEVAASSEAKWWIPSEVASHVNAALAARRPFGHTTGPGGRDGRSRV